MCYLYLPILIRITIFSALYNPQAKTNSLIARRGFHHTSFSVLQVAIRFFYNYSLICHQHLHSYYYRPLSCSRACCLPILKCPSYFRMIAVIAYCSNFMPYYHNDLAVFKMEAESFAMYCVHFAVILTGRSDFV